VCSLPSSLGPDLSLGSTSSYTVIHSALDTAAWIILKSSSSMNNTNKIFSSGTTEGTQLSTQNVTIRDNVPGHMDSRGSAMDSTRSVGFVQDVPLSEFFSRPVRIVEMDWNVASPLFYRFNPWSLFWENPRNLEKLRNYYLLKATMHVKVLVNGNAFYYGRAILGYEPLHTHDNTSVTNTLRPFAYTNADIVRLSQRMHVYINPTDSSAGSLELPFFWHKNALSIPRQEWQGMGECVLMSINELSHANGGTDPITITVLAWAENVSYSIPTANVPEMLVNEPEMADEHNKNVISRPASSVARIAGALANVPMIGPFARATEIGASAVASISKIFGYSSPTQLEYEIVVPNSRTSLAVVDTKFPTNKLTLDSKQELTIDPITTGIRPDDELPIASIAGRESYLTSFNWTVASQPDSTLFQIRVDPFLYRKNTDEYHLTACAAACVPFKYWRGTMRFRFQIVSSNYHRGRIRIVYDPMSGKENPGFNTHYTTIHDIASEKDFTVDVGWAQTEPYRRNLRFGDLPFSTVQTPLGPSAEAGNGVLSVYVLNQLTVPGTVVADIQVNVFVSALDDFEVGMPSEEIHRWTFRNPNPPNLINEPEMAEMDPDSGEDPNPITDPVTIDTYAQTMIDYPDYTKLFFGEVIGSFRQLIKRSVLHEAIVVKETSKTSVLVVDRSAFPEFGGIYNGPVFPNSMVLTFTNGKKLIPCATTPLNYVGRMFLAWRGSVRWVIDTSSLNVSGATDVFNSISPSISRSDGCTRIVNTLTLPYTNDNPLNIQSDYLNAVDTETALGAYIGNSNVNPLMSVEVPFYANKRFLSTQYDEDFANMTSSPAWRLSCVIPKTVTGSDVSILKTYCSAGEDFNFFFFNGMPPMYYVPNLPTNP